MANGFRLIGGSYARQGGSSGNSGLTDALPKQTATQAAAVGSGDIIILEGDYTESAYFNTSRKLMSDGNVRVKGVNPISSTFAGVPCNLTLQGFLSVTLAVSTSGVNTTIIDCATVSYGAGTPHSNNITYINCPSVLVTNTSGSNWSLPTSFINSICDMSAITTSLFYLYIDFNSILKVYPTGSALYSSNIQGLILRNGIYYCIPTGTDITISGGTATVPSFASRTMASGTYPPLATDWYHVGAGITATACYVSSSALMNKDPRYVSVENKNFDLLPDSPHIGKNIGGQNKKVAKQSILTSANEYTDLVNMTGGSTLVPTGTTGTALGPVKTLDASTPKIVGLINYVGEMNYNITSTGGTAGINDNVPFVSTYNKNGSSTTNTGCRLCIMIRFSNKNSTPSATTDSDWDNGNNNTTPVTGVLAGEWFLAEINQVFKYDSSGYGNGDYRFSAGNAAQIRAKYFQTKLVLVDNYNQG